jgi:gluconolactonase
VRAILAAVKAEVVVDGINFGEGPVWCPDGTLVVTSVCDGALYRVWPEAGRKELVADVGGGANAAALCADGGFLVTQNGGVDFSNMAGIPGFENPPPFRTATPGLQRVDPEGRVSYLADRAFHAPNDLVVAPDGTVYFTDPGHYPPPEPPIGRVMALDPDGRVREVGRDFWYCNGIAFDVEGNLVVIERAGLQRLNRDGTREWVIKVLGRGGGDGFCVDRDGNFYVCSTIEHGVRVVDREGNVVEFLEIAGSGVTTNCCFGGPEGRDLYATDAVPGHVVVWEGLPTPGLPLTPWPGLPTDGDGDPGHAVS